ncbi:hypothetical protein ZTR_00957 [Talaromyces verruculosus]|nr:hypothetical protein ZTR_00957 [Talaromyces verruculosus]
MSAKSETSEGGRLTGPVSTYYVYHEGEKHFLLSPVTKPPKEKKKKNKTNHDDNAEPEKGTAEAECKEVDCYFVHQPYVSFHSPPRTLRRGNSKHGTPICLIQNSWCWKRWKLQFGERLADVIDARGVVSWEYNDNDTEEDKALKGYKVRSWRLWGESGKEYHKKVNEKRKREALGKESLSPSLSDASIPIHPVGEEVHYLDWLSPMSKDVRCYRFQYAGLNFYWKGTHLESDGAYKAVFLRHNHLKLVVRLPNEPLLQQESNSEQSSELCLAKFTSSIDPDMAGTLELFESVITGHLQHHILSVGHTSPTDIHDVLIATAMCMVIGEWQKRKWVKGVAWGLVGAGVESAGA